jgi:hypothetical protein
VAKGPVRICPENPPRNGALDDQGEQTGVVGKSSNTYADEQRPGKALACVAVMAVSRQDGVADVRVLIVNRAPRPLDLDGDLAVSVSLAYGSSGVTADMAVDPAGQPLAGVIPVGQRRTGHYGFTVPAGRQEVTVTVSGSVSGMAWTGVLPPG